MMFPLAAAHMLLYEAELFAQRKKEDREYEEWRICAGLELMEQRLILATCRLARIVDTPP